MAMARTSPDPSQREALTGWGRTAPTTASVLHVAMRREVEHCLDDPPPRGALARGLGRSYGDAAQNAGGRVVDLTALAEIDLDPDTGTVVVSAGTSLDALMRALVPRGFFVPVTPGTRYVTVGGAIAADIHGKNHHAMGSWCDHVESFRLLLANGQLVDVSPENDPDLFWATAGGMGLTGVITEATIRCPRIETSRLLVDTDRAPNLDAVMAMMISGDDQYDYSVAWIDLIATGSSMGRSVLTRGRFATVDELPRGLRTQPLAYGPEILAEAPPFIPNGLLNPLSVRAFNELWYRKAPARRRDEIQTIAAFFHPLDMLRSWNRMYGPSGFLQWQYAVPLDAHDVVRDTVHRLSSAGCTSFLAVLKRFGPANAGMLSFPIAGWTLALDIPCTVNGLGGLLDELDESVVDAGGRVYLAKDSRLRPELVPAMYPRLDEWRAVKRRVDPGNVLRSDLSRRLRLAE